MNKSQYQLVKISRGEYNLVDAYGKMLFTNSKSKWNASQMLQNIEVFDRMLTHDGINRTVLRFIKSQGWGVSQYGSVDQIIRNYARELHHTDMRKMMKKTSLFFTHLKHESEKNQEARKAHLLSETDKYRTCNHHHELTDNHEVVDFGSGEFVANKLAIPLLKALNEAGLHTRTHHMDENGGFISILIEDHIRVEVKTINELHSERTQYDGLTELLISFTTNK